MNIYPRAIILTKPLFLVRLAATFVMLGLSTIEAQTLLLEAESGNLSVPFVVTNGCIGQHVQTVLTNGGRATYSFTITNAGNFVLVAGVYSPESSTNAFYVNIDREPEEPAMAWCVSRSTEFSNQIVTYRQDPAHPNTIFVRRIFALGTGTHQLIIRGCGREILLDRLSIIRVPSPPGGLRLSAS